MRLLSLAQIRNIALVLAVGLGAVAAARNSAPVGANTGAGHAAIGALDLVPESDVTHRAIASGAWSDATTWQGGNVPGDGARAFIPAGVAVSVDSEIKSRLKTLRIDGRLSFAPDADTSLEVGTIVSSVTGELEIGTAASPIQPSVTARVRFVDDGAIDRSWDPDQLSRGAVLLGPVRMHGQEKTSWRALAKQPRAGARVLRLAKRPKNWAAGDTLIVAGTDPDNHTSDETATIASVRGKRVTLTSRLTRSHKAPARDLTVHVANVTRNIKITSENTARIDRRGHVMFRHHLDVDVRFVEFSGLGRTSKRVPLDDTYFPDLVEDGSFVQGPATNVRGRYSVHFHRGGTALETVPARVSGCSVVGDPGWAFVNHSSNVDFIENVSYDVVGGAFQTEAGNETGSFLRNIAIRTVNPDDPMRDPGDEKGVIDAREDVQDYAYQGDGFWIHGGGVAVDGNVVSGASGHAYIYWPEGLIEAYEGRIRADKALVANNHLLAGVQRFNTWWIPVASSTNNTAYSASKGLVTYYLHTSFLDLEPDQGEFVPQEYRDTLDSVFDGFTIWNMRGPGMEFHFTENVTLKNSRLVGTGRSGSIGIDANQFHNLEDLGFEDVTIEGFDIGFDVPSNGRVRISNLTMSNNVDLRIREPQYSRDDQETVGAFGRDMQVDNITFQNPAGTPILMVADLTLDAETENGLEGVFPTDKTLYYFLLRDRIVLDSAGFRNARLYFDEQAPDFVPITSANSRGTEAVIPSSFVNKSNRELQQARSSSFGGELLPDAALVVPGVVGGKVVNGATRQ